MKPRNGNPILNSKNLVSALVFSIILFLIIFTQKGWGEIAQSLCVLYAIATGLFFLVQLYGFVISQTQYCEEIEAPKFEMLEKEEAQWNHLHGK